MTFDEFLQRCPTLWHVGPVGSWEGIKRRGFEPETINLLRRAYKTLYRDGLTVADAVKALGTLAEENPPSAVAIEALKDFVQHSQRGIVR